ncbi:MAG: aquaporin family protein [Alphaproteobacteria bacterium]|nr:aquaporin family protein [Alphaproteobacteria bacterium]
MKKQPESFDTKRRAAVEALGTALLVATVIGSGIMAERLAGGNEAIALLGNTLATGAILAVLITMFGPISGAHFNPAVSAAFALRKAMSARDLAIYVAAQCAGGLVGMFLAHAMFELPLIEVSPNIRTGTGIWLGEATATFRLILTIFLCLRSTPQAVPYMVALFITAGYWFTSSTSFANPAVTIARGFSDSFSGIRPADIPWFILCQMMGAVLAVLLYRWLMTKAEA